MTTTAAIDAAAPVVQALCDTIDPIVITGAETHREVGNPVVAPRIAAVESQTSAAPPIVAGWSVRDVRDGFVYVQGNGEIYQVVPGAPLPGLGPVESVKRRDGRWVVTTPKGVILSLRDRRYE